MINIIKQIINISLIQLIMKRQVLNLIKSIHWNKHLMMYSASIIFGLLHGDRFLKWKHFFLSYYLFIVTVAWWITVKGRGDFITNIVSMNFSEFQDHNTILIFDDKKVKYLFFFVTYNIIFCEILRSWRLHAPNFALAHSVTDRKMLQDYPFSLIQWNNDNSG